MSNFIQYIITGLVQGCVFGLLASGFVVIHRVTNVVNMTQGTFAVMGGMLCFSLLHSGLPHGFAELAAIVLCGCVGLLFGVVAIGRKNTSHMASLIVTFGIAIFAYAVEIAIWGDQPVSFVGVEGSFHLYGAFIQKQYVLVVAVTLVTFVVLEGFFNHTYLGKALTACHLNPYAARVLGIDPIVMGVAAFGIAGLLGGLGGVLITPVQSVSFDSDIAMAISGFAAAIVGGLLHPRKALAGGILLGVCEELVAGYIGASYKSDVALVVMVMVMVWRARGRRLEPV